MYGGVRTSIITEDPLPTMNQVYSKIKVVERVQTVMRGREQHNSQVAFAAKVGRSNGGIDDKSKLVCGSCKKT